MALACLEAFETLKLRLIVSTPCVILPEFSSGVVFTVARDASTMGIPKAILQDHGRELQPVSY
jgi:hypothetical protein